MFYLYGRSFESNRNFATDHLNIDKNSRIFKVFFQIFFNSRVQVKWQPYMKSKDCQLYALKNI